MSVEKRITATDANRRFSSLLRKVQNGERYIVT
jgi:prevent-host-death family protein